MKSILFKSAFIAILTFAMAQTSNARPHGRTCHRAHVAPRVMVTPLPARAIRTHVHVAPVRNVVPGHWVTNRRGQRIWIPAQVR